MNSQGTTETVDQQSLSDYGYAFGQFIDHDLDLTPDGGDPMNIPVAVGDPIGPDPLPFTRSQTDPATGPSTNTPLQQVNVVTSYLDLSQVYGSTQAVADALRTFTGGLLKTSPGNMLPYNSLAYFSQDQLNALNMANDSQAVPSDQLFATGDRRGNENLELTVLETLFVRNHNRLATELQQLHPDWSDEQLYQKARKLNIAEYQSIVYNEWIPAVLGINALPTYAGYDPTVNASIATEFSTVAFRFGHSLLSADIARDNNLGLPIADVNPDGSTIPLAEDFFVPGLLNPNGVEDQFTDHTSSDIGPVLKAMADGNSQAMDVLAVDDVRNLLFGNGIEGGQDLIARDIQRGRDDGIPDYNTLRVDLGLPAVTRFDQITSNVQVQQELQAAYGSVNNIDAFEGGLAEDHVAGSDVGPLFQAIMVNQFTRLRDGDRFFYLNEQFSRSELALLYQGNTLAKVIEANTPVTNLQRDVFVFDASIRGTVLAAERFAGCRLDGLAGVTVELDDSSGNMIATTVTDSRGRYSFDQLDGVSDTGVYQVVVDLPSGATELSASKSGCARRSRRIDKPRQHQCVRCGFCGGSPVFPALRFLRAWHSIRLAHA